ncbi:MAG: oxidoreductase [Desulfobulbus propionicus]|nr:MAG: oxidoreductase [Desulfobulbus propionicus]
MPNFQEKALVQDHVQLAPDIYRLTLHAPNIASAAKPGQFVMLKCTDGYDPLLRRPLSIHDKTTKGHLDLLYKVTGTGTRLLAQARPGSEIDLLGPLGRGFTYYPEESACLIGGGMGIAPLLFLARALQTVTNPRQDHTVLLGARDKTELEPLARDFFAMGYTVHLATDDGSLGHHGFISVLSEDFVSKAQMVFVCGPHPLMAVIAAQCHAARVPCQATLETHMACGLGACLGCTVQAFDTTYRHVCTHGPVFFADEILWTL